VPTRVTVVLADPAAAQLDALPIADATEIRRILGLIEIDPAVDGLHKITVPRPPAIFTCYVTSKYWIFYYFRGNDLVVVTTIERATGHIPVPW
jgi:hypothetical protein